MATEKPGATCDEDAAGVWRASHSLPGLEMNKDVLGGLTFH